MKDPWDAMQVARWLGDKVAKERDSEPLRYLWVKKTLDGPGYFITLGIWCADQQAWIRQAPKSGLWKLAGFISYADAVDVSKRNSIGWSIICRLADTIEEALK